MGQNYGHIQVKENDKWVSKLSIENWAHSTGVEDLAHEGFPKDYREEHPLLSEYSKSSDYTLPSWCLYSELKNKDIELWGYTTAILEKERNPDFRDIWPEVKELARKFGESNVRIIIACDSIYF